MSISRFRRSGQGESVGLTIAGNCVTLLHTPETCLPAMLAAIESATSEVLVEMYWFASDVVGWRFAEALAERARAGVLVRVVYDAVGSIETDAAIFTQLRQAGCSVEEYGPIAPWRARFRPGRVNHRDHRKMIVVDGRVALIGGVNLGDEWAAKAEGGGGYRDDVVRIEGPAAARLGEVFAYTWREVHDGPDAGGASGAQTAGEVAVAALDVDPSSGSPVRILANHFRDERKAIRQAYLDRIRRSRRYFFITNSYFIPDRRVRRSLVAAARRGVDVRVLMPSRSDVAAVDHASRWLWGRLLGDGIRLYAYQGPMLHAKSAVSDDLWTTVGSFNLDNRSWQTNLEINVAIEDDALAQAMRGRFERDLEESEEVTAATHATRAWWLRLLDWLFFLGRSLL